MAISIDEIAPKPAQGAPAPSPATSTPPPAPDAATGQPEAEIPDEVLAIPAFRGLLEGKPAAAFAVDGETGPEIAAIVKNAQTLMETGFGFYRGLDDKTNVVFNTQFISGDEIKKADQAGKLAEVAVPFSELQSSFNSAMGRSAAPAPAPSAAPAPGASGAPQPAEVASRTNNARIKNLQPGAPSSGPAPGQGRLLNNILKTTV